jgi:hypothetical protein
MSGDDLPEHFDLVNLLDKWPGKDGKGDAFDMDAARVKAEELTLELMTQEARFILLMGRKVERAFGWSGLKYLESNIWHSHDVILFPHPSGVNLWWNEEDNRGAARKTIRWVLSASK